MQGIPPLQRKLKFCVFYVVVMEVGDGGWWHWWWRVVTVKVAAMGGSDGVKGW